MPQQAVAVELEAIHRQGEDIQVVRDYGLTIHGYSVYLRMAQSDGIALACWLFDAPEYAPAYELAERLSLALAIPLLDQTPQPHHQ